MNKYGRPDSEVILTTKSYVMYKHFDSLDKSEVRRVVFKWEKDIAGNKYLVPLNEYGFQSILLELIGETK